ncbi:MAG: hypothetical protein KFF73_10865 [Cyclobacteriaceae bacterium]|nr:hypothetical protein [Cyclobacteriaceae bacterium]
MSDLELYIYIALALIYFLSRVFKQKKSPRPPGNYRDAASGKPDSPSRPQGERQLTFEELLQEFTGYKEPQQTVAPEHGELLEEMEFEEATPVEEEYKYYEGYDDYKKSSYMDYNQVPEKDLTTIDEQVSFEDPLEKKFEDIVVESVESSRALRYREMLLKNESIRDAIILKELLDRKYF